MWLLLGFAVHHVYSAVLMSQVEQHATMESIVSGYKFVPREDLVHSGYRFLHRNSEGLRDRERKAPSASVSAVILSEAKDLGGGKAHSFRPSQETASASRPPAAVPGPAPGEAA
jgi:hypothetical protein